MRGVWSADYNERTKMIGEDYHSNWEYFPFEYYCRQEASLKGMKQLYLQKRKITKKEFYHCIFTMGTQLPVARQIDYFSRDNGSPRCTTAGDFFPCCSSLLLQTMLVEALDASRCSALCKNGGVSQWLCVGWYLWQTGVWARVSLSLGLN